MSAWRILIPARDNDSVVDVAANAPTAPAGRQGDHPPALPAIHAGRREDRRRDEGQLEGMTVAQ
jgi:hypothetical protein